MRILLLFHDVTESWLEVRQKLMLAVNILILSVLHDLMSEKVFIIMLKAACFVNF